MTFFKRPTWRARIIVLLLVMICCPCTAFSLESNMPAEEESFMTGTFLYPIKLFRKYISGADGDRCAMHPSCSTYSVGAFRKHGVFIGWSMISDRLMRCGRDEVVHASSVWKNNAAYSYDPIENNDFWWDQGK